MACTPFMCVSVLSLFFAMSLLYRAAILAEPRYPDRYAHAFTLFLVLLGIQIFIMIMGPRSWHSESSLLLQATAQKIVVYAEILVMLYQSVGAWKVATVYR